MQSIAIERVLANREVRSMIGSVADLRDAYQDELAANQAEIEAKATEFVTRVRQAETEALANVLRCAACGSPIKNPRRISRRYCSDRCRQRAHRLLASSQ
jgi:hypothetical protein